MPSRASLTPEAITLAPPLPLPGDAESLLYEASVAHAIGHLRYSAHARDVGTLKPMRVAIQSLIEDVRVERLMMRAYPGLHSLWARFHRISTDRHGDALTFSALAARLAHALHDPAYADPNHWVDKGRTLIAALGERLHDAAAFDEVAAILASDLGQMRVRFDVQSYEVEPVYRDDNRFLWRFEESETVHAASVLSDSNANADASGDAAEMPDHPEEAGDRQSEQARTFAYPEWNYRNATLREDWVTVIEGDAPHTAPRHRGEPAGIRAMRRVALPVTWSARRITREQDGDDLDLDGFIEHAIARRSGLPSSGRVFTRAAGQPRDVSVLMLVDLSASTARCPPGSHASLLDTARETMERLVDTFDSTHHRFALHGFASNGREDVRYVRLKEFGDAYAQTHRHRLHAICPAWSTRVGAALRHAGHCLARERSASKVVVLMTDGEPSDIDVFDARYLIDDARHAVETLAKRRVRVHCVNFDPQADEVVRKIFGAGNGTTVARVARVGTVLERVVARILR